MCEADKAVRVDDAIQRHTPQFEQVDLLPVHPRHGMIRVGQADEWDPFVPPVLFKCRRRIGTHSKDFRIAPHKALIVVPQARQLRAAIWSHKPAQERQHNRLAPAKIRQAHTIAVHIHQFKVWSRFSRGDQVRFHFSVKVSRNSVVASAIWVHCSLAGISAGLSPA